MFWLPRGVTFSFPYYIVRFKRLKFEQFFYLAQSFHTTQYDLNPIVPLLLGYFLKKFPYYIVRFKPALFRFLSKNPKSFHTTQYDLNPRYRLPCVYGVEFPYYIVRFKLVGFEVYVLFENCFHTTQYDLNTKCGKNITHEEKVSILHSTI